MKNFPTLTTERLRLDLPAVSDIPTIIRLAGDKKVEIGTLAMPHPYEEADAIFWLNMARTGFRNQSSCIFAIRLKSSGELIGGMGLHRKDGGTHRAEIGYWLGVPFWGNGYAPEALRAVLCYGFDTLELHKIFGVHFSDNPASGRVMQKSGMLHEGTLVDHVKKGDTLKTLHHYRLLRSEFVASQSA